jgi:hypothetical protein
MSGTGISMQVTSNAAPCGCHVGAWWGVTPPPMCDYHRAATAGCAALPTTPWILLTNTTAPPALSDADVERIAQRVAELLKAKP